MSAKEMFEKLGYEYELTEDNVIEYWKNVNGINYEIDFDLDIKKLSILWNNNITLKELQAINKQVEELGWTER